MSNPSYGTRSGQQKHRKQERTVSNRAWIQAADKLLSEAHVKWIVLSIPAIKECAEKRDKEGIDLTGSPFLAPNEQVTHARYIGKARAKRLELISSFEGALRTRVSVKRLACPSYSLPPSQRTIQGTICLDDTQAIQNNGAK